MGAKEKDAIIGLWQEHSDVVGSWLEDNWRFFRDGKFTFSLSDALNPIRSISGSYYMEKGVLYLKVMQIRQLTGAKIVAPDPGVEFGTFRLRGGQLTTIDQNDSGYSDHSLKIVDSAGKKMIQIDDEKYYRISADPSAHP